MMLPGVIRSTLGVTGWSADTTDRRTTVGSLESLMAAVNDVVVRDQFRDDGGLISHGTNQHLPRINAMRDVVLLGHVDGIVFSLSHLLEGPDLVGRGVGVPGPVAFGQETIREGAIVAGGGGPKLHHNIKHTSVRACFCRVAPAALDLDLVGFRHTTIQDGRAGRSRGDGTCCGRRSRI